jgi:hypothetical protein
MTIRTFKQRGQAYGSLPVTIVAKIDGVEIFNGQVPTLNAPYQLTGFDSDIVSLTLGEELFSWTDDVEFSGAKTLEITVANGFLVLMNTTANYPQLSVVDLAAGENIWGFVYKNQVDDVFYVNPLSNMVINGQAQNPNDGVPSQTYWLLPPGSVMSCNVNITASIVPPPIA